MEYCTDSQRTEIVEQVANAIMPISLNMHGTRAVQKMIEFLTLPEQVRREWLDWLLHLIFSSTIDSEDH